MYHHAWWFRGSHPGLHAWQGDPGPTESHPSPSCPVCPVLRYPHRCFPLPIMPTFLPLAPPLGHHCQLCPTPADIRPLSDRQSPPGTIDGWWRLQSLYSRIVLWKFKLPFSGCKHWRPMAAFHFASCPTPNTMPRTGIHQMSYS